MQEKPWPRVLSEDGIEGLDPIQPEELWRILGMLDQDAVVGGCVLPRNDPPGCLWKERCLLGVVLVLALGIPCLRLLLEGRFSLCGCAEGGWKEVPCEEDPSCGGGTSRSHPAWEVIPCCHKGGHNSGVFTPCLGTLTPQECCLEEFQARREHEKGFPMAKTA